MRDFASCDAKSERRQEKSLKAEVPDCLLNRAVFMPTRDTSLHLDVICELSLPLRTPPGSRKAIQVAGVTSAAPAWQSAVLWINN